MDVNMLGYFATREDIKKQFVEEYSGEEYLSYEWDALKQLVGAEDIPDEELWELI